jgi:hypothetical protein
MVQLSEGISMIAGGLILLLWSLTSGYSTPRPRSELMGYEPQESHGAELGALKDAEYAFRRFDEATSRIEFERWQAPHDLIEKEKTNLETSRKYSNEAKNILSKFDGSRIPTTAELMDVIDDLVFIGYELADLGEDVTAFQDKDTVDVSRASEAAEFSVDLARAGSTGRLATEKMINVLKLRLAADNALLTKCRQAAKRTEGKQSTNP